MEKRTWSPESLGIPKRQNYQLFQDIELAYEFIEKYSRYTITGKLEGFLFELIRRRWNLACKDNYEPPPDYKKSYEKREFSDVLSEPPAGLTLVSLYDLKLSREFVNIFKEFADNKKKTSDNKEENKLYGYGTDGYGTYLPLHLFWPELKEYWGIYISEVGILNLSAALYNDKKNPQLNLFEDNDPKLINGLIQIAYQVILRHQLFHFKIEQWALMFELATGHPYYMPYLQDVYLPSIYDENDNNLEEALANLSILLSKKISKLQNDVGITIRDYLEHEFLYHQGPNYRNFSLNKGYPFMMNYARRDQIYRETVNYLCNQIRKHNLRPNEPYTPYYLYPPNNNFLRAEELCPIYLIRNLPYKASVLA
jgi:hypothetical protein